LDASTTTFSSLGLSGDALGTVARAGYTVPTPIQIRVIPPALAGQDVIGCAATGTGKTAAFALPLVERLVGMRQREHVGEDERAAAFERDARLP